MMKPENIDPAAEAARQAFARASAEELAALLASTSMLKPQGRLTLRGQSAQSYVAMVVALLERSRLDRSFPDRHRLQNLLRLLGPEANHHLYDEIEIGSRTGLPSERMVTRLRADREVAAQICRDEEARNPGLDTAEVKPSTPSDDLSVRRHRYNRSLQEADIPPSFTVSYELRRIEAGTKTAHFATVLDRFDLSEELYARYTILLRHRADAWTRAQVRLEGDRLELTRNFVNLVARTTAHDSELAFIVLSRIPSLTIESVTRSRIGPLAAAGIDAPAEVRALTDRHPGEFVLSLPTDRTALDIRRDHNGDPMSISYRDFLAPRARDLVETVRSKLGYHVHRQRKFVCTPKIAPELRKLLKTMGRPCVIHTLR
jgi:hypothetical protein